MLSMFKIIRSCKQIVAVSGAMLFVAASASAQPRTVRVEEPEEGAIHWLVPTLNREVIKAFSARVGGNERYRLTGAPAELAVVIICMDFRKDTAVQGCTYTFEFHSKNTPGFNMPLGTPSPLISSDASEIAERIFDAFVTETTETKLSVTELEVGIRVANFCSKPANQVPCSGKLPVTN
jgi:hypothetical protein